MTFKARRVPTRGEALATIYRKLRSDNPQVGDDGLTAEEANDVLFALGLTKREVSAAARTFGDEEAAGKLEG